MQKVHPSTVPSRLVKWSLVIGIVIVLNMFFNYAISLVYKEPLYPSYQPQVVDSIHTRADCISVGGQWTENSLSSPNNKDGFTAYVPNKGYCDPNYMKQLQYDSSHKVYQRTVFIALVILGIVTLIIGVLIGHVVLASALAWGGVLSLVIASMRYWSDADNLVKVIILAAALGALIWVALHKFGKFAK